MRRFSAAISAVLCVCILILVIGLSSCGNSTTPPTPSSIQFNPTSASLSFGAVQPLSATVLDANNGVIQSAIVIFSSNDPAVTLTTAAVSQGTWFTTACAGTWNSSQLICQPATTTRAVEVTATSGSLSATTTLFVHPKVDRVVVNPASVDCESQGHTHPFTATVFSGTQDVTASIGAVNWGTPSGQGVVSIDANGIATAGQPGKSSVFANVSGVTSLPSNFITCPVQSIRVHLQDSSDTSFDVDSAATQQLAADVFDINGQQVNNAALTWASSEPNAAAVTGDAVTGVAGFSSITATCLPPACNRNLNPAYGNVVLAHSSGDLNATVYAADTNSTSLIPIDVATGTVGAITLPANPNSMVISPKGDFLYLGSDQGLMTVDITSGTLFNNTARPGKVLAASQDGRVLVASATEVDLVSSEHRRGPGHHRRHRSRLFGAEPRLHRGRNQALHSHAWSAPPEHAADPASFVVLDLATESPRTFLQPAPWASSRRTTTHSPRSPTATARCSMSKTRPGLQPSFSPCRMARACSRYLPPPLIASQ